MNSNLLGGLSVLGSLSDSILTVIATIAGIAVVAVPIATELVKQHWMPAWGKTVLGVVMSLIGTAATAAFTPESFSSPTALIVTGISIWTVATTIYREGWSNLPFFQRLGAKTGSVAPTVWTTTRKNDDGSTTVVTSSAPLAPAAVPNQPAAAPQVSTPAAGKHAAPSPDHPTPPGPPAPPPPPPGTPVG